MRWNPDGKDVLHDSAVYFHPQAGKRVRFDGRRRVDFDFENYGVVGRTDNYVGPKPAVQGSPRLLKVQLVL